MLGRVVKGWDNWFHTGQEMLNALELASPFQWDLAFRDLFVPEGLPQAPHYYGEDAVWPFIITGSHPYTSLIRRIVNENGADGTVRVPAANLNVKGITIDFTADDARPAISSEWSFRHGYMRFPFVILPDRTHASVIDPLGADTDVPPLEGGELRRLIGEALKCGGFDEYATLAKRWDVLSQSTAQRTAPNPEYYHLHFQVFVKVMDDHGTEVDDYFLEFYDPEKEANDETVLFHQEVLEDVHTNSQRPALRCLYVDHTDLVRKYYGMAGVDEVAMSLSAASPGKNIHYFADSNVGAAGHIVVHWKNTSGQFLEPNKTHLVKIVIPRNPQADVFKLTPY